MVPVWLSFLAVVTTVAAGPVVSPPCGPLEGVVRHHSDDTATTNFLGIPFAEPPTGERRFSLPVKKESWAEVRDASTYADSCLQPPDSMRGVVDDWLYDKYLANLTRSEDCLYLNVYVPGEVGREKQQGLPVMVYFYGGGFLFGTSAFRLYEGDWLAKSGQVIVVSLNYRLGMFGFFSTGDDVIRGNAALYDQQLALKWIQENIASFGGDPGSVTLFGQSAGGAGVSYHVMSPLSAGLFHRAIILSGSSQDLGSVTEEYRNMTEELWADMNCTAETDEEAMICLREVPAETLLDYYILYPYMPLIDGVFVPDDPETLFKTGRYNRVPLMIGTVPLESSVVFETLDKAYLDEGVDFIELDIFMSLLVVATGYDNFDGVYEALEEFYIPDGDIFDPLKNLDRLCNMITDFAFESPKGTVLSSLAEYGVDTYHYYFMKRPSFYQEYVYKNGAHHSNDIPFVFGAVTFDGILSSNATQEEKMLSKSTMNALLSFAKGGSPKFLENDGTERDWPRYTSENRYYLEFNFDMTTENIKTNLKSEEVVLWNEVLPTIG